MFKKYIGLHPDDGDKVQVCFLALPGCRAMQRLIVAFYGEKKKILVSLVVGCKKKTGSKK